MRRIALLGVGLVSSLGVLFATAPAAHAAPLPGPQIIQVCLTVHELGIPTTCIGI